MSSGIRGFTNGKACVMNGKNSIFPANLSHCFKFVPVTGLPYDVIECQYQHADPEWYDREMLESIFPE